MCRVLKWTAGIVAAVIILSLAAVYIILSRYDFNDLKPRITEAVLDATGRKLTIGGDIDLRISLTPSIVLEDIGFENAPWGTRPEMVKVKYLEIQVAIIPLISKQIKVQRFVAREPDILVETDSSGNSNLVFHTAEKEGPGREKVDSSEGMIGLPALIFNILEIEKGKLQYRDGKSEKITSLNLNRLRATGKGMDDPVEILLDGDFDGQPFEIKGNLGPISLLAAPEKAWPLKIEAKALDARLDLDGYIKNGLSGQGIDLGFGAGIQDWTKISQYFGKVLPLKDRLEISGRLKDNGIKSFTIQDLKVALGANIVKGSLGMDLSKAIPIIQAELSSDDLDLRPIFSTGQRSAEEERASGRSAEKPKKIFPSEPLLLPVSDQADCDLKIRIKKLIAPQLAVNDLSADLTIKGGNVNIRPLKALIGGGNLDGGIAIDPGVKSTAVTALLKIDNFGIGDMLKELAVTDVIEGNIDGDINLAGKGDSVASIMAALNGHISVIMGKGRINNKYIDLLGGDLSAGLFRLLDPSREKTDYTSVNCMVSRFDIKKGLADSTVLFFDTNRMSVGGEGKIDLASEKIDLSLKPVPKEGVGGFSLSLGELSKPFKLGGTLAEPALAIDKTQAALALGKAVGGIALFGPAGLAASLIGKKEKGDEDPCLKAIAAARTGVKPSIKKESVQKEVEPEKTQDDSKKILPDLGKTLKGLFGR